MGNIWNKLGVLCVTYVFFMWFIFLLDNIVFLILCLFGKEPKPESQHAFVNAFMQRGKEGEVLMAIVNIVTHIGCAIWLLRIFGAIR